MVYKWKGTSRRNNVTFSIFACAAKGECSQISRNASGIIIAGRRMQVHTHAQERSEYLIKSTFQLTRYENRMVFNLQNQTTKEQREFFYFLPTEGVKLVAIHCRMVTVNG